MRRTYQWTMFVSACGRAEPLTGGSELMVLAKHSTQKQPITKDGQCWMIQRHLYPPCLCILSFPVCPVSCPLLPIFQRAFCNL